MMNFVAIDVETANPDLTSICQIGVARFEDDGSYDVWSSLINPKNHYFDETNVLIHGITQDMVARAPTFAEVYDQLADFLNSRIVVSHTSFDRVAMTLTAEKYGLNKINCRWLDSARVARRAWPEFSKRGYGLSNLSKHFNIKLEHHNAPDDARVAGQIVCKAVRDTNLDLEHWLHRIDQPISTSEKIAREGNPAGHLYGEIVCFTGALSIARKEAAALAADAGCTVKEGVTSDTTLLIVGDQDIRRLAGHTKSTKHRKAEKLVANGQSIRIVAETDFGRLIKISD